MSNLIVHCGMEILKIGNIDTIISQEIPIEYLKISFFVYYLNIVNSFDNFINKSNYNKKIDIHNIYREK